MFETSASFAGLFTAAGCVGEEDLGGHCKDRRIGKTSQQRSQKSAIDDHIVVEEHDDICLRLICSTIVAAGKAVITIQRENANLRKILADELGAAISATIVDDENFVIAAGAFYGFNHCRQAVG